MNEYSVSNASAPSPSKVFWITDEDDLFHQTRAFRFPVPGGWVVCTTVEGDNNTYTSSVFVPEPGHYWSIVETKLKIDEGSEE